MLERRFKLIYFPEGTSKKREFNFRRTQLYICLGAFFLALLLLSGTIALLLSNELHSRQIASLKLRNSTLKEQLNIAEEKIETLSQKMEFLTEIDNELRAKVYLPVLNSQVLQMGIGGNLPYQSAPSTGAEELLAKLDQIERQIGLQENSLGEVRREMERQAQFLKSVPSIRPVKEGAFSSFFGRRRDPFTGRWEPHMGLDINAPAGSPVYSAADGIVIYARREPAYGKVLLIDHGHGYRTLYAHLRRFYVARGDKVARGDPIGEVGNTGRSTGPHLHYEVMLNDEHLDPLDFMFDGYTVANLP